MNKSSKFRALPALILAAAGLLSACGSEENPPSPAGGSGSAAPTITSFDISPSSVSPSGTVNFSWASTGTHVVAPATQPCTFTGAGVAPGTVAPANSPAGGYDVIVPAGTIPGTYNYVLTCTGPAGTHASATRTLTVNPGPASPNIGSFSITPTTVVQGGNIVLRWAATGTNTTPNPCALAGQGITPPGAQPSSSPTAGVTVTVPVTATPGPSNYSLSCTGPGGTTTVTRAVTITPPIPTVDLTLDSNAIAVGGSANLTWVVTNATSCTASGAWAGTKTATGGTEAIGPFAANDTRDYTLTCVNGAGGTPVSDTETLVVGAGAAPTVTISVSPTVIESGDTVTVTYDSTRATTCTAQGADAAAATPGWTGPLPVRTGSAGFSLGRVYRSGSISYGLSCTGPGGTTTRAATLVVNGADCGLGTHSISLNGAVATAVSNNVPTACLPGLCGVENEANLLTPTLEDSATMSITLGVGSLGGLGDALGLNASPAVSVLSSRIRPAGKAAGFVIGNASGPLSVSLLQNFSVSTIAADGTVLETATPDGKLETDLLTFSVANLIGLSGPERYVVSFTPTKPYRGVRVQYGTSLLALLSDLQVYGACVELP